MSEEEEKPELIRVDFLRRAVTARSELPESEPSIKFMEYWKRFCKQTRVKSVFILTVDEGDHVEWGHVSENEHHSALAALTMPDFVEEVKLDLFYDDIGTLDE
jgi:hypothetical protein